MGTSELQLFTELLLNKIKIEDIPNAWKMNKQTISVLFIFQKLKNKKLSQSSIGMENRKFVFISFHQ